MVFLDSFFNKKDFGQHRIKTAIQTSMMLHATRWCIMRGGKLFESENESEEIVLSLGRCTYKCSMKWQNPKSHYLSNKIIQNKKYILKNYLKKSKVHR